MNDIIVAEPKPERPAPLMAGGKTAAIIPRSMEEAYRIAKAVCAAGMAPSGLDTPEKALVAIMHGLEIGLTPMAALQRIAVVNGRPTIWGDGAMSLVRGSGACEYVRETFSGDGDVYTAICTAKRRGEPEPIVATFSVGEAKKAGLWNKEGPWQQFPKRMLQMRARAFALRDGFADVLGGLYLREEIEDVAPRQAPQETTKDTPQTVATKPQKFPPEPPPHNGTRKPPNPNQAAVAPSDPQQTIPAFDWAGYHDALNSAATQEEADGVFDEWVEKRRPRMSLEEEDEAQALLRERCDRFFIDVPSV